MAVVEIEEKIYSEIEKFINNNKLLHKSIRNFVNITMHEKLLSLGITVDLTKNDNNK